MHKLPRKTVATCLLAGALIATTLPNGVAQAQEGTGLNPQFEPPKARTVSVRVSTTATSDISLNGTFDYVIEVTNKGSQPATATLTDVLPAQVQIVGAPALTVLTPSIDPLTSTFDASISPQGAVLWSGTLGAGAKMQIKFTAQLISCPTNTDDDDDDRFAAMDEWEGGVVNAVVLRSDKSVSIASASFMPAVCKTEPPVQQPVTPTVAGADVFVRKFANIHPNWNRPERGWEATWLVVYGNRGSESATDVVLTDTPSGNSSPELVRSAPAITPALQGGSLVFNIGALTRLQGGAILFRTPLTYTTPAGTVLSNAASISATNDVSATNNTSAVSLTVPSLPPAITYPTNGATCTGTLTLTGLAQAGSQVNISVDQANVVSATASSNGVWSATVFLEDGVHVLRASTNTGNGVRRSHPVVLKVNSELLWDPISLTFTAPDGSVQRPRHYMGWFNQAGWYVTLAPSTTYTSSVRICCTDPATVTMTVPGTGEVPFTDADGDKIFTASFTTGDAKSMLNGKATLCVSSAGASDCGMGRIVPLISSQRRQVVALTKDGFYPPTVRLNRNEAIEIINMDDASRALSTSPSMSAMTGDADAANGDGIYLGTGESYVFEATGATTLYDARNSNQKLTITAGSSAYLPLIKR